jgi:hypothetical protein
MEEMYHEMARLSVVSGPFKAVSNQRSAPAIFPESREKQLRTDH